MAKRYAGKIAGQKARATYRSALRMPKRKLAKMYATKVGQTTYTVIKKRPKRRSFGRRVRSFRNRFRRTFNRRRRY